MCLLECKYAIIKKWSKRWRPSSIYSLRRKTDLVEGITIFKSICSKSIEKWKGLMDIESSCTKWKVFSTRLVLSSRKSLILGRRVKTAMIATYYVPRVVDIIWQCSSPNLSTQNGYSWYFSGGCPLLNRFGLSVATPKLRETQKGSMPRLQNEERIWRKQWQKYGEKSSSRNTSWDVSVEASILARGMPNESRLVTSRAAGCLMACTYATRTRHIPRIVHFNISIVQDANVVNHILRFMHRGISFQYPQSTWALCWEASASRNLSFLVLRLRMLITMINYIIMSYRQPQVRQPHHVYRKQQMPKSSSALR